MKETVGKVAQDLINKDIIPVNPVEQMQESLTDWDKNIHTAVERGKEMFPLRDFFIVVLTKREKLLPNVLRNLFFPTVFCPTPNYDQTVYHYHNKDDELEFIWTIPGRDICHFIKDNVLSLPKEQHELIKFVLDFADGTLMKKAKQLNKEPL
jgi:hypothetical protein